MSRRTVAGPFASRERGAGVWEFAASEAQILVRFTGPGAITSLQDTAITSLDLHWRADGVAITLTGSGGSRNLLATTVFIHEPRNRLYEGLPLAGFDIPAQRFWRRIFTLMRIPGGHFLLGAIVRRRSRPQKR